MKMATYINPINSFIPNTIGCLWHQTFNFSILLICIR